MGKHNSSEITFISSKDGVKLHGTLSGPIGKSLGAVLFLVGSGKTDRDETTPAELTFSGKTEKLFVQLSDALVGAGYTTFRYDKRGVLDSNRNVDLKIWKTADREHLISDAVDAAKFLIQETKISTKEIMILGHSEGTIIATETAIALGGSARALLLLGAQARSMKEMLHYQIVESRLVKEESAEVEYQKALKTITSSTEEFAPDGKPINWYRQFLASPSNAERLLLVNAKKIIFQGEQDPQTPLHETDIFKNTGVKDLVIFNYPGLGHGFSPDKEGRPTLGPIDVKVVSDLVKSIQEGESHMKSYYYAHESAYKKIKEKGYVGWGNAKTIDELGDASTNEYLRSSIEKYFTNTIGLKAFDLGCGTGTTAFTLAKFGFSVTGLDISETAIEMAHDLAEKQNLKINFQVGDVLSLDSLNEKFDLIYDSHCLHCIVFDDDRSKVLTGIKNSLNEKGIFILDTMAMDKNYDPTDGIETLRFDDDYILWHKMTSSHYRGVVEVNGQLWCAQRRIYPSKKIIEEVIRAGFKVIEESIDPQNENEPSALRMVLGI